MIRVLHVVIVSFFGKQYNNRGRWMPLLHLPLFVFFRLFVKCGGCSYKKILALAI